jgi:hypothetical protein
VRRVKQLIIGAVIFALGLLAFWLELRVYRAAYTAGVRAIDIALRAGLHIPQYHT